MAGPEWPNGTDRQNCVYADAVLEGNIVLEEPVLVSRSLLLLLKTNWEMEACK